MIVDNLVVTSLETIELFDLEDNGGDYIGTLDELQNASISQSEDKTDITGKKGRKISSIKTNKACKISATNGVMSHALLEIQTNSKFKSDEAVKVLWSEWTEVKKGTVTYAATSDSSLVEGKPYYTKSGDNYNPVSQADLNAQNLNSYYEEVADYTAKVKYTPVGTTGQEISGVYKNDNGTAGEKLTQNSTAAAGKFAYNNVTGTLSFAASDFDYKDGEQIVIWYYRSFPAGDVSVMSNDSGKYSKNCQIYVNAFAEDKCTNKTYRMQFHFPRADVSGNFEFTMGDSQSVHSFEADALGGSCGKSGIFFDYIVYKDDYEGDKISA